MKTTKIITFCFLLASSFCLGASLSTDSLRGLLANSKADSSKVKVLQQICESYYDQNNYSKSLEFGTMAIKLAQEIGRKDLEIFPNSIIGMGFYDQAQYDKSYQYFLNALQLSMKLNYKQREASMRKNIGNIFLAQENSDKALSFYNEALQLYQQIEDKDGVASCFNNIGLVYEHKKDLQQALNFYNKAYDFDKKSREKSAVVSDLTNIGNIYKKKKEYDKALKYYLECLDISEKENDKEYMSLMKLNIGMLYEDKGNKEEAIDYINKGISIAKGANLNDNVRYGYENLAEVYSKVGDYKSAYENHILFSDINDTIENDRNTKNLLELQTKYETGQKEAQIKLQNEKIARQALVRNSFIIGCVFLALIIFLLYNRFLIKKKSNKNLIWINGELESSNKIITEQSLEISQSISYAQKIQEALLPDMQDIKRGLTESFVLYIPKDVVSGDFYWYSESESGKIIAAIDAIGHSVGGAFVTVMAHNSLFQITKDDSIINPSQVLKRMHENITESLKQKNSHSRYSMDVAMCKFNNDMTEVEYAGAMRPMYHIRNESLTEYKADKHSIGGYQENEIKEFTPNKIALQKGDCIYMSSDGYADQFGGADNKKFMTKGLKSLLISISAKPMEEQRTILEKTFMDWKGDKEQIDDILIIGVKA